MVIENFENRHSRDRRESDSRACYNLLLRDRRGTAPLHEKVVKNLKRGRDAVPVELVVCRLANVEELAEPPIVDVPNGSEFDRAIRRVYDLLWFCMPEWVPEAEGEQHVNIDVLGRALRHAVRWRRGTMNGMRR